MVEESDSAGPSDVRLRRGGSWRAGTTGRLLAVVAVAVVAVLAGIGLNAYLQAHRPGPTTLVIDAFPSLFTGNCGNPVLTELFNEFDANHSTRIVLDCPGESQTLLGMLSSPPQGVPSADLVIGLDEVTGPQADADGLLVPYSSAALPQISPALVQGLAPDHSLTPYDFGDLAIDYTSDFANATHGAVANLSLPELVANSSWAKGLALENPIDTTGEEFLLSEIAFYQSVLHQDWTSFWRTIDPLAQIYPDWSTAFYGAFGNTSLPNPAQMVVSYGLDPAYENYSPGGPSFNASLYHWNGSTYAWKTIYGLGIVRGSGHIALDQQFIDWFLGASVQSAIPLNDWEYPANGSIALPTPYRWAANASGAIDLNADLPVASLPSEIPGWLDQWQAIANAAGT